MPYLYALERDENPTKSYLPHQLWLFTRKRPQMRFTPKQQQHLIYALLGQSDRELQGSLDISEDTVNQAWKILCTGPPRRSRIAFRGNR